MLIFDPRPRAIPLYTWLLIRYRLELLAAFLRRPFVRAVLVLCAECIVSIGFACLLLYALAGRS